MTSCQRCKNTVTHTVNVDDETWRFHKAGSYCESCYDIIDKQEHPPCTSCQNLKSHIQKAIDIIDGLQETVDYHDESQPPLLRKLCEHLENVNDQEQNLVEKTACQTHNIKTELQRTINEFSRLQSIAIQQYLQLHPDSDVGDIAIALKMPLHVVTLLIQQNPNIQPAKKINKTT